MLANCDSSDLNQQLFVISFIDLTDFLLYFLFAVFLLCFQVNSTALDINLTDLNNCDLQLYPITITPTIPVRRTIRGLPWLTFYTPKEAVILENCVVQLKQGIEPVQIIVKANCQQHGKVSVGLKPIVPRIWTTSSEFWSPKTGLPTIWVIIILLLFKYSFVPSNNIQRNLVFFLSTLNIRKKSFGGLVIVDPQLTDELDKGIHSKRFWCTHAFEIINNFDFDFFCFAIFFSPLY